MKELIQYQIEVAICLAILTMLYLLLWRKETNFVFKRILLLGIPILSFAIPLINLEITWQQEQESNTIQYITYLPGQLEFVYTPVASEMVSSWEIAFWIFIAGAIFMMVRMLTSYFKIWQIFHHSVPDESGEYSRIDSQHQSFSFFNLVMINHSQAHSKELDYILAHEKAHSRQGHSYDVMSFELLKILHWFNPLIWFITREGKQNLEYLADQEVTNGTRDIENYQYAIVHHASQSNYQLLKTHFSKSNLKNRIVMMNQPNNRRIKSGKLIALIPVIALLFMSFSLKIANLDISKEITAALPDISVPQLSPQNETITEQKIVSTSIPSDTLEEPYEVFTIVEDQPTPSTGDMKSYYEILMADQRYPEAAKSKGVEGRVFVQFIVQKDGSLQDISVARGIGAGCDEEAVRLVKEGPTWLPGKQRGRAVNVRLIIPIPFGVAISEKNNSVAGRVIDESGSPIAGCNVLIKGTTTGTVTDSEGQFNIKLPDGGGWHELVFSYVGYESEIIHAEGGIGLQTMLKKASGISIRTQGVDILGLDKVPVYIIDGVEVENFNTNTINPNDVESITVLKDSSATIAYGEKGKNGVILIKTKNSTWIGMDIGLYFDEKPKYNGEEDAVYGAIQKQIKYPLDARKENIEGVVEVSFTVTKDGKVENIQAGKSGIYNMKQIVVVGYLSKEIDQRKSIENYQVLVDEVIRVLKTLGDFDPGKKEGKPVDIRMTLPVSFRLQ